MKALRISETFFSIEGEGPLTGTPTLFIRTFGCNFTCSGFNGGCDTKYSWHPDYRDQTILCQPPELEAALLEKLPGNSWSNPITGVTPVVCFTGGEPLLQQKAIACILNSGILDQVSTILFETNGSVALRPDFIEALNTWTTQNDLRYILWSNSPKLSNSGEPRSVAIQPAVIYQQCSLPNSRVYLKFVVDGSTASFDEVVNLVNYYFSGLDADSISAISPFIYVMPEGSTKEDLEAINSVVANKCLAYGFTFCSRTHIWLFGNSKGT